MKAAVEELRGLLGETLKKEFPECEEAIEMAEPRDKRWGDFSSNIALRLGGGKGEIKPQEAAEKIIKAMPEHNWVDVSVAAPGFINFKLKEEFLQKQVLEIIQKTESYAEEDQAKGKRVLVEFVSANPTGPLTVGNSRGGVIGDVLSNILAKRGWNVTREYYFNDAGGQIDVLGHSVLKDEQAEYKGEYINELHDKLDGGDYREIGKKAAQILIEEIKQTTKKMGIEFDNWFAEGKDLREKSKVKEVIEWLKRKDLLYEEDGAWWFRSTKYGDDKDRVVVRSNGEPTYFGVDAAYHKNKFVDRKFDLAIDIWGPDHHGDVARVKGFVKALGYENKFEIIIHQLVKVLKDGKEVRMSKRAGNFVLVEDIINEISKDAYRFFMLQYAPNSHLVLDVDLAKERSQKNPVYYVQYAHARIKSILRKMEASEYLSTKPDTFLELLREPEELDLIRELIRLPGLVEEIAKDYQVQKLTTYAMDLARSFHNFYEKCRVIDLENKKLMFDRYELIQATAMVLKNTLDLMGVSAPEKMEASK